MTPVIDRGRTLWATGPSEAVCLMTKEPPAESYVRCHLQFYDKCLGPFLQLPLCSVKTINLQLWISVHGEVHISTRAAIRLERECWTMFEVFGWLLSGMVGRKQHFLRIGSCQMEIAKWKLSSRNKSQRGWIQCSRAEEVRASQDVFWQWNNKGIESSFKNPFGFMKEPIR